MNEYAAGGVPLDVGGYFGMGASYVAMASPVIVGVGMGSSCSSPASGVGPANPPF